MPGRKYLVVVLVVLIGIPLSAGISRMVRKYDRGLYREQFERSAAGMASTLQRHIDEHEEIVNSVVGLFEASVAVDRDEFRWFTKRVLKRHAEIQALEWIPRVPHRLRPEYERRASAEGIEGFRFTEISPGGEIGPASRREEYFPVYYVEPLAGNESALGFDLGSNPARLASLSEARDTGLPVVTGRITLVQETEGQYGFLLFVPFYRSKETPTTVGERRRALEGFGLGVFRVGEFVEESIGKTKGLGIAVELHDVSVPPEEGFLGSFGGPEEGNPSRKAPGPDPEGLRLSTMLEVPGRKWEARFAATPVFAAGTFAPRDGVAFASGVLLTLALAAYLAISIRRTGQLESLSGRLSTANLEMEREIGDRRRAEEGLRASEARFRQLVDLLPLTVYESDAEGRITYVSRACEEAFGYAQADFDAGVRVPDLLVPEDRARGMRNFRRILAGAPSPGFEYRVRTKEGSEVPVLIYSSPVHENGAPTGLRGIVIDISDRKRAEEERDRLEERIRQVQKMESLGVLAGGIAHDFNNLLMGILGNADLAQSQLPPGAQGREYVRKIVTAALTASELTNQMLAYSGKGHFLVERIDLNRLVEETSHLLSAVISKKSTLAFDLPPGIPAIEADASQIRQVAMNLITNASESLGGETGEIRVLTGVMEADRAYLSRCYLMESIPEGSYVFLEVSDTGAGMAEETVRRIFDPFFTTKIKGRGLGLASVLGIVRGHRGAIRVESMPGKGTTFRVLFPAAGEVPEIPPVEPEKEEELPAGTVLVVDDDAVVRDVTRSMLEISGFRVLAASDGREGIDLFRARGDEICVVILDMTMPEMNGEETFREIRKIRPDALVVLTSGYHESDATSRFAGKGLAGFLQKPYRASELLEKIRQAMRNG